MSLTEAQSPPEGQGPRVSHGFKMVTYSTATSIFPLVLTE